MVDKEKLKYYRELNNYTPASLAKKIKISKKMIMAWESGEAEPTANDIIKLAATYNISSDDLMYDIIYENAKHIPWSIIVAFIWGIVIYILERNYGYSIMGIGALGIFLNCLLKIKDLLKDKTITNNKSLFGVSLDTDKKARLKIYLTESLLIASFFITVVIVFKLVHLNAFLASYTILPNKHLNVILIYAIYFTIITLFTFIINFLFGEIIVKQSLKEGSHE